GGGLGDRSALRRAGLGVLIGPHCARINSLDDRPVRPATLWRAAYSRRTGVGPTSRIVAIRRGDGRRPRPMGVLVVALFSPYSPPNKGLSRCVISMAGAR